jgi:uncharacterized protein YjbJ (UPF0337 family)
VGNERLTAEGRTEQAQGDMREAKEKAKGGARKVKAAFKR